MMCNVTRLDDAKVQQIKAVEQEVGKTLLAYSCYNVSPADLNKDELARISEAEQKLGVVLVAIKS
jgi:hypothetical protein